jgi:hypothetical protein
MWIASSLAALYLERRRDYMQGQHWLDALAAHLRAAPDEWEAKEHDRLQALAALRVNTRPPNKGMKQAKPEHNGASQLIPSVRRTNRRCT